MSEITPKQVAAALTGGDDVNEVLNRWVDVNAIPGSSTVRITVTPINEAGDPDTENARHFWAVVVEGETVPDLAEADRLRQGMRDLYARWIQRAIDNGDYYNRTAGKYENGKAVAFDAAAEEIRALIGDAEAAQAENGGGS